MSPPHITVSHVYLWRHGRTDWNTQRRYQGQADVPLNEVGRAQARTAAYHLAAREPELIVSSDLVRAAHTATELAEVTGLPVRLDPRLRELFLGHWEGLTRPEVAERFPQEYADWLAGRPGRRGGGELRSELADRATAALADLDGQPAVLVTHGATALALTGHLLGLAEPQWRVLAPLSNCHWSELRRDAGGWQLRSHNVGAVVPPTPPVPREVTEAERAAPEPTDAEVLGGPVGPSGRDGPDGPDGNGRPGEPGGPADADRTAAPAS